MWNDPRIQKFLSDILEDVRGYDYRKMIYVGIIISCCIASSILFKYWYLLTFGSGSNVSIADVISGPELTISPINTAIPIEPSPSPFQPLENSSFSVANSPDASNPSLGAVVLSLPIPRIEDWNPSYSFYGVDFSNREPITIKILPTNNSVNGGKPIRMIFTPGNACKFGDRRACVYAYKPTLSGTSIFLSIHSGIGGQGEAFRRAVEGVFINSTSYSLDKINLKLKALSGAQVIISQGDKTVTNLELTVASRIPPQSLNKYFKTPLYETLDFAAKLDHRLESVVAPEKSQIIFETCGWKNWDEPWVRGITATSASIYLGVIQQVQD